MKKMTIISASAAVFGIVVIGAIWIGTQSGSWKVVHDQGQSLTIPATWHPTDNGQAYLEQGRPADGLWFLKAFSSQELPSTAKKLPKVGPNIHEWQIKGANHFTYYAVWTGHDQTQAIKIHVPKSQQNLAQAVLGSWQPG